tara:strand:+ start:1914 stop:2588 length:675 start_codon:yes stop_codon:yes gene_type:complete
MDEEKENSVVLLTKTISEQDNSQKIAMYTGFIMEFYRVLMGSFLIVFVPQKCDNDICTLFENVVTTNPVANSAFSMNLLLFAIYVLLYYVELKRENKLINYLHVNPELPRDNESVGNALVNLHENKLNNILLWDKRYQTIGRLGIVGFVINLGLSGYVIFTHYLDNKTVTVFLTNALFMGLKLNDVKTITETEKNVFLSAYLMRKVQYNDVDPDKKIKYISDSV